MNVKAASVTQLFIKARAPRRVHPLPDVVFHTIVQGIHAVVVFMLAGFCHNQLGSLISDRKAVFRHHGRTRLGWEACLKRIRARFQTHDFVGVGLDEAQDGSSAVPTRGSSKSIRSLVSFFSKEAHDVDRRQVSVSMRLSILATAANC